MENKIPVPYKLSFRSPGRYKIKMSGWTIYQMGNGSAGWTVAWFSTEEAAQAFADTVPVEARFPHPDIHYNRNCK